LFCLIEMALAEASGNLLIETLLYGSVVGNSRFGGFFEELTIGLKAAELGGAFVKQAMGLAAGAVDRVLEFGGGFVLHRVLFADECSFDLAAAAQAPDSPVDFVGQSFFERADRSEGCQKFGFVLRIKVFFAGTDEVCSGEKTEFGRVPGGYGLTFGTPRADGGLGVGNVGCDLSGR
jgi:hypothetical protein